jgi:hypothetical protein
MTHKTVPTLGGPSTLRLSSLVSQAAATRQVIVCLTQFLKAAHISD